MLPASGPGAFVVSFAWTTSEYQELARLTLARKRLISVGGRVSGAAAAVIAAAVPVAHLLASVPWSEALVNTAPWFVLFGLWWLLASQSWRLPPTVRGKNWNEVPEERAVTTEEIVADGGWSSARLRWRDIDVVEYTPQLVVLGRGSELVGIPRRALTPEQLALIEKHVTTAGLTLPRGRA